MMLNLVHHFPVVSFFIRRLINSTTRLKINIADNPYLEKHVRNQHVTRLFSPRYQTDMCLDSCSLNDSSTASTYTFPRWKRLVGRANKPRFFHSLAVTGFSSSVSGPIMTTFSIGLSTCKTRLSSRRVQRSVQNYSVKPMLSSQCRSHG